MINRRIAFIVNGLGIGGLEKLLLDYVKILSYENELTIFNLDPTRLGFVKQLDRSVKIYNLRFNQYLSPYLYYYGIKKYKYGLMVFPFFIYLLTIFNYIFGLLHSFYYHNLKCEEKFDYSIALYGQLPDLTFSRFNYILSKNKIASFNGGLLQYILFSDGYYHLFRRFDKLLVNNTYLHDLILNQNKYLINSTNIIKIVNPISIKYDYNYDQIDDFKNKYGDFILLISRMSRQKDFETPIRAMHDLVNNGFDKNMVIVGGGPTFSKTQKLLEDLGLRDRVFLEGEKADVENYYKSAFCFVHSSPFEGGPGTIIEAMAHGVPVITSKSIPGVPELTNNGEFALVFEVGDIVVLKKHIKRIYDDEALRTTLIKKGVLHYQNFTMDAFGESLKRVFR